MRARNLPGFVLEDIRVCSLQYPWQTALEARGMIAEFFAAAPRLDADELNLLVTNKVVEDSDRVRSAANTGNHYSGQFPLSLQYLLARLLPNDAVKIPH